MRTEVTSIGIQGIRGSYHDIMAVQMFGGDAELFNAAKFHHLFEALDTGEVRLAVAAIANNRKGPISETNQALMTGDYFIVGEGYLSVKHQLLGIPGATIDSLREVHTQDHAREQCADFLDSAELPHGLVHVDQDDTAKSAKMIAEWGDPTKAAIASADAGRIYGLEVIRSDIQDDPDNLTRFLQLQKRNGQQASKNDNRSAYVFTTGQQPGSLVDALTPMKTRGINVAMLHSSYIPNSPFSMKFAMEVDAGLADPLMVDALEEMVSGGCSIAPIGSYVRSEIPHSGAVYNGK